VGEEQAQRRRVSDVLLLEDAGRERGPSAMGDPNAPLFSGHAALPYRAVTVSPRGASSPAPCRGSPRSSRQSRGSGARRCGRNARGAPDRRPPLPRPRGTGAGGAPRSHRAGPAWECAAAGNEQPSSHVRRRVLQRGQPTWPHSDRGFSTPQEDGPQQRCQVPRQMRPTQTALPNQ